jgi:transposase-like protein
MMDVEVESLTGAAHGERSAERTNQRNGYRTREWHTGVGTVPVAIPKLRKSTYFPSFLEPRRSADKAMIAVIQEAYVHGISTRSVDDLVKAMGMTGISNRIVPSRFSSARWDAGSAGSMDGWNGRRGLRALPTMPVRADAARSDPPREAVLG